jgi:hypothetical protein
MPASSALQPGLKNPHRNMSRIHLQARRFGPTLAQCIAGNTCEEIF